MTAPDYWDKLSRSEQEERQRNASSDSPIQNYQLREGGEAKEEEAQEKPTSDMMMQFQDMNASLDDIMTPEEIRTRKEKLSLGLIIDDKLEEIENPMTEDDKKSELIDEILDLQEIRDDLEEAEKDEDELKEARQIVDNLTGKEKAKEPQVKSEIETFDDTLDWWVEQGLTKEQVEGISYTIVREYTYRGEARVKVDVHGHPDPDYNTQLLFTGDEFKRSGAAPEPPRRRSRGIDKDRVRFPMPRFGEFMGRYGDVEGSETGAEYDKFIAEVESGRGVTEETLDWLSTEADYRADVAEDFMSDEESWDAQDRAVHRADARNWRNLEARANTALDTFRDRRKTENMLEEADVTQQVAADAALATSQDAPAKEIEDQPQASEISDEAFQRLRTEPELDTEPKEPQSIEEQADLPSKTSSLSHAAQLVLETVSSSSDVLRNEGSHFRLMDDDLISLKNEIDIEENPLLREEMVEQYQETINVSINDAKNYLEETGVPSDNYVIDVVNGEVWIKPKTEEELNAIRVDNVEPTEPSPYTVDPSQTRGRPRLNALQDISNVVENAIDEDIAQVMRNDDVFGLLYQGRISEIPEESLSQIARKLNAYETQALNAGTLTDAQVNAIQEINGELERRRTSGFGELEEIDEEAMTDEERVIDTEINRMTETPLDPTIVRRNAALKRVGDRLGISEADDMGNMWRHRIPTGSNARLAAIVLKGKLRDEGIDPDEYRWDLGDDYYVFIEAESEIPSHQQTREEENAESIRIRQRTIAQDLSLKRRTTSVEEIERNPDKYFDDIEKMILDLDKLEENAYTFDPSQTRGRPRKSYDEEYDKKNRQELDEEKRAVLNNLSYWDLMDRHNRRNSLEKLGNLNERLANYQTPFELGQESVDWVKSNYNLDESQYSQVTYTNLRETTHRGETQWLVDVEGIDDQKRTIRIGAGDFSSTDTSTRQSEVLNQFKNARSDIQQLYQGMSGVDYNDLEMSDEDLNNLSNNDVRRHLENTSEMAFQMYRHVTNHSMSSHSSLKTVKEGKALLKKYKKVAEDLVRLQKIVKQKNAYIGVDTERKTLALIEYMKTNKLFKKDGHKTTLWEDLNAQNQRITKGERELAGKAVDSQIEYYSTKIKETKDQLKDEVGTSTKAYLENAILGYESQLKNSIKINKSRIDTHLDATNNKVMRMRRNENEGQYLGRLQRLENHVFKTDSRFGSRSDKLKPKTVKTANSAIKRDKKKFPSGELLEVRGWYYQNSTLAQREHAFNNDLPRAESFEQFKTNPDKYSIVGINDKLPDSVTIEDTGSKFKLMVNREKIGEITYNEYGSQISIGFGEINPDVRGSSLYPYIRRAIMHLGDEKNKSVTTSVSPTITLGRDKVTGATEEFYKKWKQKRMRGMYASFGDTVGNMSLERRAHT